MGGDLPATSFGFNEFKSGLSKRGGSKFGKSKVGSRHTIRHIFVTVFAPYSGHGKHDHRLFLHSGKFIWGSIFRVHSLGGTIVGRLATP